MSLSKNVNDFMTMLKEGKFLDAFEKYYSENCSMQENDQDPRKGKDANRKFEIEWFSGVEEVHGFEIRDYAANEDTGTAFIHSWMDLTFKGQGRMKMEEVSIQHWKDGKIFRERFIYKNG